MQFENGSNQLRNCEVVNTRRRPAIPSPAWQCALAGKVNRLTDPKYQLTARPGAQRATGNACQGAQTTAWIGRWRAPGPRGIMQPRAQGSVPGAQEAAMHLLCASTRASGMFALAVSVLLVACAPAATPATTAKPTDLNYLGLACV